MNLLVMENLFYNRRFTKVSYPGLGRAPLTKTMSRYMTLKAPHGTVMFNQLEKRMKYF
jgi:hypothetical protein